MQLSTDSALCLDLSRFNAMSDRVRATKWMYSYMSTPALSEMVSDRDLVIEIKYLGHRFLELGPGKSHVIPTGLVPNARGRVYKVVTPKEWSKRGLNIELMSWHNTSWPQSEIRIKLVNSDTQTLGFEPGAVIALLTISKA